MCKDKTIKELLTAYAEQVLDQAEKLAVESHLASCDDCRAELSLLRMMAEETVPDPGEAFWATMPDRVYQAVQQRKTKKKIFDFTRFLDRMVLPRWTWAAATVGTILIISWFIVMPLQNITEMPQSQVYELADATMTDGSVSIAELDPDELNTIDTWAGRELASITEEARQVIGNSGNTDLYEALDDLRAKEAEHLSNMLDQRRQEG